MLDQIFIILIPLCIVGAVVVGIYSIFEQERNWKSLCSRGGEELKVFRLGNFGLQSRTLFGRAILLLPDKIICKTHSEEEFSSDFPTIPLQSITKVSRKKFFQLGVNTGIEIYASDRTDSYQIFADNDVLDKIESYFKKHSILITHE
jgi:hypothetical protein